MTSSSSLSERAQHCAMSKLKLLQASAAFFLAAALATELMNQRFLSSCLLAVALLATVGTIWALRRLEQRQHRLVSIMKEVAKGHLGLRLTRFEQTGPLGEAALQLNRLLDLVEAFIKESDAAMLAARRRQYYRKIIPAGLQGNYRQYAEGINLSLSNMQWRDKAVEDFVEKNVEPVAEVVARTADEMLGSAAVLDGSVNGTSQKATNATDVAGQTARNVAMVAAAAEELSYSIKEISTQAAETATTADAAVKEASAASAAMQQLSEAAGRIEQIIHLISGIASQTNMLSLNATIEANRAGEAGRGFAVVAGEVKALSAQTAKASEEVSVQIAAVQQSTEAALQATTRVCSRIEQIQSISSQIANAVEEQNTATAEITRNIHEISAGTQNVSQDINGVGQEAAQAADISRKIRVSAGNLGVGAARLQQELSQFRNQMQATSS